jgi:transposase-like protein
MITERTHQVSNASENPTAPLVPGVDARRRAADLYRTTDLDVAAIAAQEGVSRLTVVRWLRREGIPLGPKVNEQPANPTRHDALRSSEDIVELRGQLAVLIAQVGRLEELVEAPRRAPVPPDPLTATHVCVRSTRPQSPRRRGLGVAPAQA